MRSFAVISKWLGAKKLGPKHWQCSISCISELDIFCYQCPFTLVSLLYHNNTYTSVKLINIWTNRLIWPIQNDAINLKNGWNPRTWVLIWEYSARAIQWIPPLQGLDGSEKSLHPYTLDESSPALEWEEMHSLLFHSITASPSERNYIMLHNVLSHFNDGISLCYFRMKTAQFQFTACAFLFPPPVWEQWLAGEA